MDEQKDNSVEIVITKEVYDKYTNILNNEELTEDEKCKLISKEMGTDEPMFNKLEREARANKENK